VVICLEQGADLHMAQLIPLPFTVSCFSKIQIGFTFWYRLTWVVPEKGPLNGCVCVCVQHRDHGQSGNGSAHTMPDKEGRNWVAGL